MYIPLLQASFDHPSAFMCKNIWKRKMQSVMLKWELVELKPAANFLPGKGTVTVPGPSLQSGCARLCSSWVTTRTLTTSHGTQSLGDLSFHHVHPQSGPLEMGIDGTVRLEQTLLPTAQSMGDTGDHHCWLMVSLATCLRDLVGLCSERCPHALDAVSVPDIQQETGQRELCSILAGSRDWGLEQNRH